MSSLRIRTTFGCFFGEVLAFMAFASKGKGLSG
jgi:hypothetical protein